VLPVPAFRSALREPHAHAAVGRARPRGREGIPPRRAAVRGLGGRRAVGRLVDVSPPIEPGMVTYPGLPGPVVSDFLSREASRGKYAEGTTFAIARVDMVGNTGPYVAAPFHRFALRG